MNSQKILNFNFPIKDSLSNFYVNDTNSQAFDGILKNKNDNEFYLTGPAKSGKSFIAKLWATENNALILNDNFDQLINASQNILIDNFDNTLDQEKIFHILNHCKLNKLKILIVSKFEINEIKITLEDLTSRLKAFLYFKIKNPDDDMLLNILTKLFVDKQFIINSHDVFQFIIKRANRSYEEIFHIVSRLDSLS